MKLKRHFLMEEKTSKVVPGELKKAATRSNKVPIYHTRDKDPKTVYGYATNFKYSKGIMYCDLELPEIKGERKVAVVPMMKLEQNPDGLLHNITVVSCLLTHNPADVRCFLSISS